MPTVITLISTFAAAYIGGGVVISTLVFGGVNALLYGAIGIGLNLLAQSLIRAPQAPRPEDVQSSVKQPAQPRARHYGRVKVSGPWVFAESLNGQFHKILALGQGPIDAVEQFWVDDNLVTLSGGDVGYVTSAPYNVSYSNAVTLDYRLGAASETAYAYMLGSFPEWTSSHKGNGVASIYAIQSPVKQEDFFSIFPNGINTNYRAVLRGAKVYNPVTATTAWNDNAAAVIRDYMTHVDGMRLPSSIFTTPLADAGWQLAYNFCTQDVAIAAGGYEDRYRLWGTYLLNERPADVLGRMLISCDGRIYPTPDGGISLDIGYWSEPSVVLDEDAIVGFTDLARGKDVLSTANVVRATYLGTDQDYQTADADPWIDTADVALRGEIEIDTSFIMSPSHSQTRRLMKLTAYRVNPTWVGSFQCNLRALAALGQRFVRIQYPAFSIDEVFEVQDFRFIIGDGGILQGVSLQVQSMPEEAYDWDTSQEGTAPTRTTTTVSRTIPAPSGFGVTQGTKTVAGQLAPYAILAFTAPAAGLKIEAQGKRTVDSQWIPIAVQDGANTAESFILSDGEQYEFQIRNATLTGRKGAWTSSINLTPTADTTPPGAITSLVATGGAGQVAMTWVTPNSANFQAVNIRRNTTNSEGGATLIRTEYGPASSSDGYTNTGLSAGTYYYWLKSRNASGVESASVASGAKVVT